MPDDQVHQPSGRGQNVLAVIHHHQHRAGTQIVDHGGLDVKALLLLKPQRRGDGVGDSRTVIERSELAKHCAIVELFLHSTGDLEGQPGLADASDAGQRHQRTLANGADDDFDVVLASNETGDAPWHARPRPSGDGSMRRG